jgi:hypothetical protein
VNYKVLILEVVKQTIASWGLSREMMLGVYNRLCIDLASNPDEFLIEKIVPLTAYAYNFTLTDTQLPYRHWFMFAVERLSDNRLSVIGARHSTEDSGEN